jgi:hypothetical protein
MTPDFTTRSRDFLRPGASQRLVFFAVPKRDAERTDK